MIINIFSFKLYTIYKEKRMTILEEYIVACTNLYGCVSKEKIIEIFNEQSDYDVEDLETVDIFVLEEYYITDYNECYILSDILAQGFEEELISRKENKPYYIPEAEELLNYIDFDYYDCTKEYDELAAFLKETFQIEDDYDLECIMDEIHMDIVDTYNKEELKSIYDEFSFEIPNHLIKDELLNLTMRLYDNTRRYEHNGYTPKEIENL